MWSCYGVLAVRGCLRRFVDIRIVVCQIAVSKRVPLCWSEVGLVESARAVIKLGVVIRAYADDVLQYIRSVMGGSQWLNMMGFSVPAPIRQYDRVIAELALVVV
ncbi:hypothetical protein JF43_18945 [Pseudomonas aeruginosa]|nr:hypothetical protein JF43_18945 [Pseudomonas aeruginosa]